MVDSALSNMHIMLTGEHLNALKTKLLILKRGVVLVRLLISSRVSN